MTLLSDSTKNMFYLQDFRKENHEHQNKTNGLGIWLQSGENTTPHMKGMARMEEDKIFEGWRDKKIYECYKNSISNSKGKLKKETSYGLLHAMGVKDIERIACTCENFNRKYVIISDSDRVAIEKKRDFKGSGKWICYSDIENVEAVTSEDFLTIKFINDSIKKVLTKENIKTQIILNNNNGNNKLSFITSELEKDC
ncbi:MAG: hypothetical protein IPI19_16795 [Ignavibacteriales bacterium]|nr:hypothetical protein [Ignavibacteriales bacterium]